MSEEEKKALKYFYNLRATIDESYMLFDVGINIKCEKEMIKQISTVLNLVGKQQEEIEDLKASHIITHNKVSDEEKAKLFDVIDNSIDTYLEQTKPYWEQIMIKEKMAIEEAETIIDDMYQDRNKIIETTNDKGVTIHIDRLDDVKFTNLEFASVRALREIQSLRRKLEKKDKIIDEMAKNIVASDSDLCAYIDITKRCKHYAGENKKTCDDCIKQYFENKVEGSK